jgi:hypothetical protein
MSKHKSFISVHSVVAALETQKKLAQSTPSFLEGMSLPNPKNYNKGQAIYILNPEGIPSHSPGLRQLCHQKCRNPYRIDLQRGGRCPRVGLRPNLGFYPLPLQGA